MIGTRRRSGLGATDSSWPGFVDALSSLLLVLVFLLSLFVFVQFFLGQALSGRDEALAELKVQVLELGNLLRLEQEANAGLRASVTDLSASLTSANADRDRLSADLTDVRTQLTAREAALAAVTTERDRLDEQLADLNRQFGASQTALTEEQQISARARAQVARLEASLASLRDQLARLEAALEASEERDERNQAVIVDLGRRLNTALAGKVEELAGYRSEFFGRLKDVLASRPEIRIEGDRFVFASELLFRSASADLGAEGRAELAKFADTLLRISSDIPGDLNWILRVDGHTDKRPIRGNAGGFQNNWQLSSARAIAVVQYLVEAGVPPERLAATGFGEFQPLDPGDNDVAYARNRRIEMRLTQR